MFNDTVPRRHLLAASAAALAGTAAVAAPMALAQATVPCPDADLQAMVNEWIKGQKRLAELDENELIGSWDDPEPKQILDRLKDLERRIARTKAQTLEGVLSKARMAQADPIGHHGLEGDMEDVLTHPETTAQFIGLSVILDLLRMNTGQA
jgi:hypothetical protein